MVKVTCEISELRRSLVKRDLKGDFQVSRASYRASYHIIQRRRSAISTGGGHSRYKRGNHQGEYQEKQRG